MASKDSGLHCSFCGKGQREVKKLIAGPNVYICDECIQLCNDIIAEEVEKEELLDAVTALSGSGPAYFFLMIESMVEAAKKLGLDAEAANQLALQTALGAAKMAKNSDVDVVELRRRVTSPAGTTEAAIKSFEIVAKCDELVGLTF